MNFCFNYKFLNTLVNFLNIFCIHKYLLKLNFSPNPEDAHVHLIHDLFFVPSNMCSSKKISIHFYSSKNHLKLMRIREQAKKQQKSSINHEQGKNSSQHSKVGEKTFLPFRQDWSSVPRFVTPNVTSPETLLTYVSKITQILSFLKKCEGWAKRFRRMTNDRKIFSLIFLKFLEKCTRSWKYKCSLKHVNIFRNVSNEIWHKKQSNFDRYDSWNIKITSWSTWKFIFNKTW